MKIMSMVVKKSGKPFQHGLKQAMIVGWDTMIIRGKELEAAELHGCSGPVELRRLKEAPTGGTGTDSTKVR
ncbi:MAG: hypothetical protein KAS32_27750 [Candidatus Peribacteraceae bacterium]|nr:hypothetical protein [Candidatus Peribacteraceae bacterium]